LKLMFNNLTYFNTATLSVDPNCNYFVAKPE